jgi:hypothetical protein
MSEELNKDHKDEQALEFKIVVSSLRTRWSSLDVNSLTVPGSKDPNELLAMVILSS